MCVNTELLWVVLNKQKTLHFLKTLLHKIKYFKNSLWIINKNMTLVDYNTYIFRICPF